MSRRARHAGIASPPLVALVAMLACSSWAPAVRAAPASVDRIEAAPPSSNDVVAVETVELEQRLALPAIGSFAALTAQQRARLDQLRQRSAVGYTVHVLGECLLVTLSDNHPVHPFELLLCGGSARLVVFSQDRWAHDVPWERLADLLDGGRRTVRTQQDVELARREPPPELRIGGPFDLQTLAVDSELAQRPEKSRAAPWPLRLQLDLATPTTLRVVRAPALFYALVAPLLLTRSGELLLEALAARTNTPTRWLASITNESFPESLPPRLLTTVVGTRVTRLPAARFLPRRKDHRVAHRLPKLRNPGKQSAPPDQLAMLRNEAAGGDLQVRNESNSAALVYLDGVMLGWVGPGKAMTFAGPRKGFYRIYATSPTGARSWGPADLYLPGAFTLE